MQEESFVFTFKRATKNKVVFESKDRECPISTIHIENWSDYAQVKSLTLTLKPDK